MSTEKADAKGILNTIEHAVQVTGLKCNELLQKVVVLDFNEASVMTGVPKGVAALLKETNACIVSIHCFGQRLELAYKESLTKVALGEKVVTLLIGLYYFYHNSPLNCSNLRSSFKVLGKKVVIPSWVDGTRWVAHCSESPYKSFEGL